MSTQSIVPPPDWCGLGVMKYTRDTSCAVWSGNVQVFLNTTPPTLIGQITFDVIDHSFMNYDIDTFAQQLQVRVKTMDGDVAGTSIGGDAACSGWCTVNIDDFPQQSIAVNQYYNGESLYRTMVIAFGADGVANHSFPIRFCNPTWTNGCTGPIEVTQLPVRCDNHFAGRPIGCVIPKYTPYWQVAKSGSWPVFAQHVADAQASGLPGRYPDGTPLQRTENSSVIDQNRRTACPSSYPRPPGFSCDEYPFASTYQGAALSGGGPRTQPYCGVVLLQQSTGAQGYSVCMIPADQNSGAGNAQYNQFYYPKRVIDGDSFRVRIYS